MADVIRCRDRIVGRVSAAIVLGCAAILAGCSSEPQSTAAPVPVVRTQGAATPAAVRLPAFVPASAPSPAARSSPTPLRRAFVDPPLPTELVDPAGLLPLPPGPAFATNQADHTQEGMRP